ncbi:MAG: metallophosphatase, partial [Halobacteriaceae archaeon]
MSRKLWVLLIVVVTVTAPAAPAVGVTAISGEQPTGGTAGAVTGGAAPTSHGGVHNVSIQEIQEPEGSSGASPYDGQTVTTTGVVTAVRSDGAGYYIQNGTGQYSGVYVYTGGGVDVSVGDRVRITAPVTEYYGLTEIDVSGDATVEVLGTAEVPDPTVVETGNVGQEAYEGVLVAVENVEATSLPDSNGEWVVNDGSGPANIASVNAGDDVAPAFQGENFSRIVGPVTYSFGAFKILPKTADSNFEGTTLTVLAYTDIGSEAAGDGTMGRFITLINQRRAAATGPVVVVGNGDEISPHSLRGKIEPGWEPPIRALNIIDPAAEAVQNHELDYDEAQNTGDFSIFAAASNASEF